MHTSCYVRFWLLVSVLLSAGSSFGQRWLKLYDKTDSLIATGQYKMALTVARQTLAQAETEYGKDHPRYAQTLGCIGRIQVSVGKYADSDSSLSTSRELYKKLQSDKDSNYIEVLGNLGTLYRISGKFDLSETLLFEALHLQEQLAGKRNKRYLNMLGDLGNLYLVRTDYQRAEPVLRDALALKTDVFGNQHTSYLSTLNSLGVLYSRKEDYALAERYLEEALHTREKTLGTNHPLVAPILDNIGFIYLQQGAYESAIPLFSRAIIIYEKSSPGSQSHFRNLTNVAVCYMNLKQYDRADSLYRKTRQLIAEKLGDNHPDYAAVLNNQGFLNEKIGQNLVALHLYEQALAIYNLQKEEGQSLKASVLNNLADTYFQLKRFDKSDSLYRVSLAITGRVIGTNSLEYAGILNNFARLLEAEQKIDSSIVTVSAVQATMYESLSKNFLYQTARQKQSLLAKWTPTTQTVFDIAYKNPRRPDAAKLAYSGSLFLKNLLLSQQISLFRSSVQNTDSKLRLITDTLQKLNNQIAAQYTLPIAQRKNLDSLEARAERLEKELARQSASFRQAQQALRVRWEAVRDALKPDEAAVEFVSFPYHNGRQQTDTVRYLALVLRPGDAAPQVVPLLTDEAPLRRLLAHKKGVSAGAMLYATRGSELDTDQLSRGDSLYQLIWQPIDKLLTKVQTVWLSPAGLLHQVAFAALPYSANSSSKAPRYLADRYQLRQVGSTRQVAAITQTGDTYKQVTSATLFGGIQYDSLANALPCAGAWPFLPGSAREVAQIGQLIGPKASLKTGTAATETAFKAQSGQSPGVLHLATHGFAFADPLVAQPDSNVNVQTGGTTFRRIANPLFRTGLLMAGANRVWQGGRPALGEDDGILTAYEVANLDLANTKLVVLSACETALGDIRGSEGVFGLQRAFKMAGAQHLLLSLWPVPDQVTSDLMTLFYKNWKKHQTIRRAYEKTQAQMRQMYPPAIWASFVLVE